MNFQQDFDDIIIEELGLQGVQIDPAWDSDTLRYKYFYICWRLIEPQPRRVEFANNFSCPLPDQQGLNALITKIEQGEDLSRHLSRSTFDPDADDGLLDDWKIYHLHLGIGPDRKHARFDQGTSNLLYAKVENDRLLALCIAKHGIWSQQQLLHILHDNWPESLRDADLGVLGIEYNCSDEELKQLRAAGVITAIDVQGTVYGPPGGGRASDKSSVTVRRQVDYIYDLIEDYEEQVKSKMTIIESYISEKLGHKTTPDCKLIKTGKMLSVIEKASGLPL